MLFLPLCLLVIPHIVLAAEWEVVAETDSGDKFFVDKSFIELASFTDFKLIKTQIKHILSDSTGKSIERFFTSIARSVQRPWPLETKYTDREGIEYRLKLLEGYYVSYIVSKVYLDHNSYAYITVEERFYNKKNEEICVATRKLPSPFTLKALSLVSPDSVMGAIIDYCVECLRKKGKL